jgi:initiation factor 1A
MVKNLKGGSKSKQIGRKFVTAPVDRKVRLIHEEGEIYAVVTKLLGNGMFTANDIDGKERLVVMRNKFRGKGKRDNAVSLGSWVMIGERGFETGPKPKCDLLEVYTDIEKQKLKKSGNPIFLLLKSEYDNAGESSNDDGITFSNGDTEKYKELIAAVAEAAQSSDDEDEEDSDDAVEGTGAGGTGGAKTGGGVATGGKKSSSKTSRIKHSVIMDEGDEINVDDI